MVKVVIYGELPRVHHQVDMLGTYVMSSLLIKKVLTSTQSTFNLIFKVSFNILYLYNIIYCYIFDAI